MNPSVLIFDSGVGGLSILSEIRQLLPGLSLHYLMDSAAFPYGLKADDVLMQRIPEVCVQAVRELQPQILVIACNTASTLALPLLRQQLDIPVVGVVPAIKTAAAQAGGGRIGLLATPATINRPYVDQLQQDFAAGCELSRFGSSKLVEWAENYLADGHCPDGLYGHLAPWLNATDGPTHVVLGCTHFPLLRAELSRLWPEVRWIDSGAAIARRVATLSRNVPQDGGTLSCFWTGTQQPAPEAALKYLQNFGPVSRSGCLGADFLIQASESV